MNGVTTACCVVGEKIQIYARRQHASANLSSCSVACNQVHRETHPPEDPNAPKPSSKPLQEEAAAAATPTHKHDPANPFAALDMSSDRFVQLFKKYPGLPKQLLEIHTATQPPVDGDEPDRKGIPASLLKGLPKKHTWNHDMGIKQGKDALRKARRADGEQGEGIREYCELITHLMNSGEGAGDVSMALQRQATAHDAQLVERLLAEEKR